MAIQAILLITASAVEAACTPPAGAGMPPPGTTVTCSNTTLNQNPLVGYGDGSQNGLTINVVSGASVAGTGAGIAVGANNTINNSGTIKDDGSNAATFNGISTNSGLTLTLTNTNSGAITAASTNANAAMFGVNVGNLLGSNAGTINVAAGTATLSGTSANEATGINATTVNFNNSGTISATGSTVNGTFGIITLTDLTVTNSGTISATGGTGSQGTAIANNTTGTLTVTNLKNGVITGIEDKNNGGTINNSLGILAAGSGAVVITNAGTIHGDDIAIGSLSTTSNTIVNTGTISGPRAILFIGAAPSSVENGGIISAVGNAVTPAGNAITFGAGSSNVLTLDPGSSIIGRVVGAGADTFQLGGAGTDSFDVSTIGAAAQYRGFTTFNKLGTSTWTLTGTNAAALPWTVNAGTLLVDGSIANSTVTVNAAGTFGGSGTVGSTTILGGTLAPGSAANAFGPLTVQGNLSLTAASTYMIQVSPTNAGRTNVIGNATLNGATVNVVFLPGSFVSKKYTIVNTTGNVNGIFNPTVISNNSNIQSSLSYDANDAFLNIELRFTTPPNGSLNRNQQNVANALTNFFNVNGGIPGAFAALSPVGLTQASGELATGSQQTTFDAMNQFMGLLTDPFIARSGDGAAGAQRATPFAAENDAAYAYTADGKPASKGEREAYAAIYRKAPPMADPLVQRWSVWAAGYGGSQTTDGNGTVGSNMATSRIFGTAVGADYRFSPFTLAGFALAGGGTNFSVNGLGTGRSDLFQAGAYLRHTVGPAYISAALAYGWQDITTDRTVTIAGVDQLRAEFNANAFSGRVESGYRLVTPWMNGIGITPYAAGQFTTFDLPAYAEHAVSGTNTFALTYG